ncbi:cell division protein FtsQ/DivIB [Natronogracilivirga saccharolytica]|uniref:FtsQ-type POTRA domain-containing protein n=1 Tax=Natronogracilivirga saccharolytica TaxID=2812953 RepID=A0A8J7RM24_9BACT|nr:FtsQ-type POTRA domain-containing protein [Natronogracilivirga saccharolytica]MBP3193395.1 FtsQ-type POTRA domain-containing protein [Natronogracilivirga saccharolytica]
MSKKKKAYGVEYLFAALFLVIGAVVAGWYLTQSSVITGISVQGNYMIADDDVLAESGLQEGEHRDSVVFLDVIENVERIPWVASAHMNMSPSGNVRIRVEEEDPIALLVDGPRNALVTDSGVQLPVILGKVVDVPILYGFDVTGQPDTLSGSHFEQARDFLTSVREYPGLYAMISEVMVTDSDGVVALSDENTVRLTFGTGNFDDRIRKWQAFQSQVIPEKGMQSVRSLDFRFRGQIVARE